MTANDGVAHHLVFLVRERLRRRDSDGIAGMHAHRIEILDGTDDHAVVHSVAHHFHLEFLPANQRFFDQHFVDRREIETARSDRIELFAIISDAATGPAQSECRPNDERKRSDLTNDAIDIRERTRHARARHLQPDAQHRFLEQLPIFAFGDGLSVCSDQFHAVSRQSAVAIQFHRSVQRRLSAQSWQE